MNFLIFGASAIVPLIVGAIWYNPKVFGTAWMKHSGVTEEQAKSGNMIIMFGLTLLFSIMLSLILSSMVIHQSQINSLLMNESGFGDPNSELTAYINDFMANYGENFRTIQHGVIHGIITCLFFVMPIIAINALFERKSFMYVLIHVGYWMVSLAIMASIISAFLEV